MPRFTILFMVLALIAAPVSAQEKVGWLDRIFGATEEEKAEEDPGGYLEGLIEDNLSGEGRDVEITGFDGALSGRATLETLTIADRNGVWLTISDAVLDWNRSALLRGRIEVAELSAETILLPRLPDPAEKSAPTPEASGFALPELPVSIAIDKIEAARVEIGAPVFGAGTVASAAGALKLDGGDGSADLEIRRLDGAGDLLLDTSFSNSSRVLSLDLGLVEGPDGILANLTELPGRPALDFSVKGEALIDEFSADIRLATDGIERISGRVATTVPAEDSGATLRIIAELGGDIAPIFAPDYQPFFGPNVSLNTSLTTFADGRMTLDDLALSADAVTLNGRIEIASSGLPERIDVTGQIAAGDGSPVLLPLTGPKTRVDRVDLRVGFDADAGELWSGEFRILGLKRAGISAERLDLTGTGRIRGTAPREVSAALQFDATALDFGQPETKAALGERVTGSAEIAWTDGTPIRVDAFQIVGESYRLAGETSVAFSDNGPNFSGLADFEAGQLSAFSGLAGRELGGSAAFRSRFQVAPLAGTFDLTVDGDTQNLTVDLAEADRVLAGEAEVSLDAVRDETGLAVSIRRLRSPNAELTGSAELRTGSSSLDVNARLADAALVLPQLSGPIEIEAVATQNDDRNWAVQLGLDGAEIKFAAKGTVLDPFGEAAVDGMVEADISDLSAFAELARRPISGALKLEATGAAALDWTRFNVVGEAGGKNLESGIAEIDTLLRGALVASIDAAGTSDAIDITALKIDGDLVEIAASGTLGAEGSALSVKARLADVSPFAQGFSGPLTAEGRLSQSGTGQLNIDIIADGPGGITARIAGGAALDFSTVGLSVTGTAPLGLANRFIEPRSLSGSAQFDLEVNGPLTLASASGQIISRDARFVAPEIGVTLDGIALDATLGGARANVSASAAINTGGRISAVGPIDLVAPFAVDLNIDLAAAELTEPRLYRTIVDGSLSVTGALAGGARISGDLNLGETTIRIPSTGLGGAGEIPSVIHLNEPPPVRGTRRRAGLLEAAQRRARVPAFPLDVRIRAPNRVFVRGRGLDSEFGGDLRITGTTRDVLPIGAFNLIRGRLDILGQRLNIEEATITVQGSFVPVIRIRATTQAEDTTVNVLVQGPATDPDISFTSEPELPEEEVLARLIFGRGIDTLSPIQAARLALAVRTLAGRGGEGIVGNIRQGASLADFDVTTDNDGTAAVRAGAYLGENLYTDVNVGADGETRLNLNLDVTPSVTLKGSTSNTGDTSIGIFFERDY